jgi:galactokinase
MNRAILLDRLLQAGLSASAAERKADLFQQASLQWERWRGGSAAEQTWFFVPGRIEVLGKHTDYAGGRSLLCAVERGFCVVISPRSDQVVRVADTVRHLESQFALSADLNTGSNGWSVYPKTVARRIARNFPGPLRGLDMVFASDLPSSAGLSSSSALVIATFLALSKGNDLEQHPAFRDNIKSREDLATYLGCVENGETFGSLPGDIGVGTFGGSEDHTAILCCRAGQLSQFRFRPVSLERTIALPRNYVFVIGVTGVVAEKTGSAREKYNRVSQAAKAILEIWQKASGRTDPTLFEAIVHSSDALQRIRQVLSQSAHPDYTPEVLLGRFDQFVDETTHIIPEAVETLARNDLVQFGKLVDRSQAGAEHGLRNQVLETLHLARSARQLGAPAASAFGAGFGGAVWAIVGSREVEGFVANWKNSYCTRFPSLVSASDFLVSRTGPSAFCL